MKQIYSVLIFFILFSACTEQDNNVSKNSAISMAEKYFKIAANKKKPLKIRCYYNNKAFSQLKNVEIDSINIKIIYNIILNYRDINRWQELKKATDLLYLKSTKGHCLKGVSLSYLMLGAFYKQKENSDSSFYFYSKAKKIFQKQKDFKNLSGCYFKMSILQLNVSDYWNSELSAIQSYKYSKISGDKAYEYCSLMMMAILSNEIHEYDIALEKHLEALRLVDENDLNFNNYKESSLNNVGCVYQNLNKYTKAIHYFNIALRNKTLSSKAPDLYAVLLDNLAYSNFKLKKYNNVSNLFLQALRIRKQLKTYPSVVLSYTHLSEYSDIRNDDKNAKIYANEALNFAKKSKSPASMLLALEQVIKVDKKNSSLYSQQYIALNDSLQLAERKTRNKFARIAFETDELALEKAAAVKQKWIILGAAGLAISLVVTLLIIKIQRARQKELLFAQHQQTSNESIYRLLNDQQIKIDEGRQAEKKRIAQELHDGVMNRLTSTRLNLFILNKKKDDETINKCLSFIDDIQEIEKEIRQVAHDLNNDIFSGNNSFHTLLESLFHEQKAISQSNIFTESDKTINWEMVGNAIKMNIYRILQEAIQNANKYSLAKNIYVTLSKDDETGLLHITIHDDGIGFNIGKIKSGIGLKNMTQRVESLSGTIDIRSRKGKGTIINIAFQIRDSS